MKTVRLKITLMIQLPILVPQVTSTKPFNWLDDNHMRARPGKCHILLSSKTPQVVSISGTKVTSSTAVILLGIIIDSELYFKNHPNSIFSKMSRKVNVLGRIINNCMPLGKRGILMKIFTESQFNYCSLMWMLRSKNISKFKINRLYERASRIVYSDYTSSFEGLLYKENSCSIHERNIQSLAKEIYKFLNGSYPGFLNNVFHKNSSNPYALRNRQELSSRNPKTVRYGTETISYMAPTIWIKVPETIKMSLSSETRMCLSPLRKIFATCWFH